LIHCGGSVPKEISRHQTCYCCWAFYKLERRFFILLNRWTTQLEVWESVTRLLESLQIQISVPSIIPTMSSTRDYMVLYIILKAILVSIRKLYWRDNIVNNLLVLGLAFAFFVIVHSCRLPPNLKFFFYEFKKWLI